MSGRAQANLLGLAAAVVLLTAATAGSVALADLALSDADTDPATRHAAESLAGRLVAADAAHVRRQNVANESALRGLNATDADRLAPAVANRSVVVTLGDETLLARGDPGPSAVTVRRLVRVERPGEPRQTTLDLRAGSTVTLPNRTRRVGLVVDTGPNTTVTAVRANDRVVLTDPDGLAGAYDVRVPPVSDLRLAATTANGATGSVTVRWTPTDAAVETLEVTVGAH
jgi:hypothetical protein